MLVKISENSYSYVNNDVNYFTLKIDKQVIIKTWMYLTFNKNGELRHVSRHRLARFENLLWRRWGIKVQESEKYTTDYGVSNKPVLIGPMIKVA